MYQFIPHSGPRERNNMRVPYPCHVAVEAQDVEQVETLLSRSPTMLLVPRKGDGFLPIHVSAKIGNAIVLRLLLSKGGKQQVCMKTKQNLTALHLSALKGHVECVRALCNEENVKLTETTRNGANAFHLVAQHGHHKVLQVLIDVCREKGLPNTTAILAAKDKDGWTVLHFSSSGHPVCTKLLLEAGLGADPLAQTRDGSVAAHFAAEGGDVSSLKSLIQTEPECAKSSNYSGYWPIHCASEAGHVESVLLLSKYHRSENRRLNKRGNSKHHFHDLPKTNHGFTPVICASRNGHSECVRLLLEIFGTQAILATDKSGNTAVHHCAMYGHDACLATLLAIAQEGRNIIDSKNQNGDSPLVLAAKAGHRLCIKLLLAHGADVSSVSTFLVEGVDGGDDKMVTESAVEIAARYGHIKCVQELVRGTVDMVRSVKQQQHEMSAKHRQARHASATPSPDRLLSSCGIVQHSASPPPPNTPVGGSMVEASPARSALASRSLHPLFKEAASPDGAGYRGAGGYLDEDDQSVHETKSEFDSGDAAAGTVLRELLPDDAALSTPLAQRGNRRWTTDAAPSAKAWDEEVYMTPCQVEAEVTRRMMSSVNSMLDNLLVTGSCTKSEDEELKMLRALIATEESGRKDFKESARIQEKILDAYIFDDELL